MQNSCFNDDRDICVFKELEENLNEITQDVFIINEPLVDRIYRN